MTDVLARRDRALSPEETAELVRVRAGDAAVVGSTVEYGTFTLYVANEHFAEVARVCRDERVLAYDFFDCLFGIDARDEGFDIVAILYSTSTGNRVALRTRCPGGRETPTCPSLTAVYRGANWHEREAWDMFGIEFPDHPGLEPRIFTIETFEGWPLRKDFPLASRVAKPWPGVKEPAELDEDGNVIERQPQLGDAPGPYELDKAMAEQAKLANPQPVSDPATREGEEVEDALGGAAELAPDSGAVLAGDAEHSQEQHEDVKSEARVRAEAKRKSAAEARARKAAERAAAATGTEAAEAAGGAVAPGEDQFPESATAEANADAPPVSAGQPEATSWGNEADAHGTEGPVPGSRGQDEPSAPGDEAVAGEPAGRNGEPTRAGETSGAPATSADSPATPVAPGATFPGEDADADPADPADADAPYQGAGASEDLAEREGEEAAGTGGAVADALGGTEEHADAPGSSDAVGDDRGDRDGTDDGEERA
ncbi:NADH-quinone oxidoreductase subunit C [Egicoccus halophilus]|uniref:Dehydrogenase n=1 Tax=Egicoccus halophilus TaxID=1670830 RepID=A0A8J3A7T8_9ACTN|nr:NADH-quinone oxidoreductase subunit C [Egicoccus halophilus]GGI05753.1 dehydrogenase [Egicoccus halophilus]